MFGFIKEFLHRKLELRKWREKNPHNNTFLINPLFDSDCVSVGKETYGPLNVEMSRHDVYLKIGNFCSIANGVTFVLSAEHNIDLVSTFPFKVLYTKTAESEALAKGDIIVDDDVWIGYGATILSGVHIGQGAVIAAGAIVTKDVEPYQVVAGIPAKPIKYRFDEGLREELLKLDFSKLDRDLVEKNIDTLYLPLVNKEQLKWMPKKSD